MRYVLLIFGTGMFVLFDWFYHGFGISRAIFAEIGRVWNAII